jgi:hypothetical protein
MGGACSMHGRDGDDIQVRKPRKIILKCTVKKQVVRDTVH